MSLEDRRRLTWVIVGFVLLVIVANLLSYAGWPGPSDQDKWCAAHDSEIKTYMMQLWAGDYGDTCSTLYRESQMGR